MKPFREFYKDRHPDVAGTHWAAGAREHVGDVCKRMFDAMADYMDALREELQKEKSDDYVGR